MPRSHIPKIKIFSSKFLTILISAVIVFSIMGAYGWLQGDIPGFYTEGLSAANRLMNQMLGVVLTSIALVIPLTSNLYSPKLVRLYVTHPLIILGLSSLVFGQVCVLTALLLGSQHPLYPLATFTSLVLVFFTLCGILPYLFFVSHFLRPAYFMGLLSKRSIHMMNKIAHGDESQEQYENVFDTVDVIANIALTGMRRGDRRLILLCLRSLHKLLLEFLVTFNDSRDSLKGVDPFFVSGLVREGREYLREHRIWPEAYILAHLLEIMEQTDSRQHQLLAETAGLLVESASLSIEQNREDLIELHVLVFNALMRMSVEANDVRKFQNLTYHYRLLVEKLAWTPAWMDEVVKHMVHYGKMAYRQDMRGAYETVLYDVAELALSLAKVDEHLGTDFVESHAVPAWFDAFRSDDEHMKTVAWRSLIRVYWEAHVMDCRYLAELLKEHYLFDDKVHKRYLEKMLQNNRPLHWEFNDRLLRMAYLTSQAESMAWEFVSSIEDEAMIEDAPLRDEN